MFKIFSSFRIDIKKLGYAKHLGQESKILKSLNFIEIYLFKILRGIQIFIESYLIKYIQSYLGKRIFYQFWGKTNHVKKKSLVGGTKKNRNRIDN